MAPLKQNFPHGFTNILAAARRPVDPRLLALALRRLRPAQRRSARHGQGARVRDSARRILLAGAKVYARFLETCSRFIEADGASFFKFDGLARSVNETEAMLRLTRALRALKPDLFISITTGTWPSPFWLWYGDSTWRGGGDMGFPARARARAMGDLP